MPARGREEDRQKGRETKRLRSVKYLGYTLFAICPGSFNGHGRLHIDTTESRAVHVTHAQVEREGEGGLRCAEAGGQGREVVTDTCATAQVKRFSLSATGSHVCVCVHARACVRACARACVYV